MPKVVTEEITSRNNPKIKSACALLSAAERKKTGLFIIEGARLCSDAVKSGFEPEMFFFTAKAKEKYTDYFEVCSKKAKSMYLIAESVSDKLSDTGDSQQMFCVCRKKPENENRPVDTSGFYVMTENVQNPDNLGAVVRSCEALGASGLIVASGCDIYSPKALRASMGALLRFPVIKTNSAAETVKNLKSAGMKIFSTVVSGNPEDITKADKTGGCVCIIGNEGNGVSEELKALSTALITIPMKGRSESLNAAAAAAITVWEFTKDR